MSMKRTLVALSLALGGQAALAAVPTATAPAFNAPVKMAEGGLGWRGHRPAVGGTNVFVPMGDHAQAVGQEWTDETVRVLRSANGGALWNLSEILQASDYGTGLLVNAASARVAVSGDGAQQVVHAIWAVNAGSGEVYYSSWAAAAPAAGWSTPALVFTAPPEGLIGEMGLAVTPAGVVHVVVTAGDAIRHFTAPAAGQPFTGLTIPTLGTLYGDPSVALDPSGTLHVAWVENQDTIRYARKAPGATAWPTPSQAYAVPGGELSNHLSLACTATTTTNSSCYVSFAETAYTTGVGLKLLSSTTNPTTGVTTWASRNLAAGYAFGSWGTTSLVTSPTIGTGSSAYRAVTVAWDWIDEVVVNGVTTQVHTVKVWRINNLGTSWSSWTAPVTVRGEYRPGMVLDATNKVHLVTMDEVGAHPLRGSLLYLKER